MKAVSLFFVFVLQNGAVLYLVEYHRELWTRAGYKLRFRYSKSAWNGIYIMTTTK